MNKSPAIKTLPGLLVAAALLLGCNGKPPGETKTAEASLIASPKPAPPANPAPSTREIRGTVFVATRGGQNVMLGSVMVYALEWEAAKEMIKASKLSCLDLAEARLKDCDAANAEWDAANHELLAASAALENATRATAKVGAAAQAKALDPFQDRLLAAAGKVSAAKEKHDSALASAKRFSRWGETGEVAFHSPPTDYIAMGATDAKGEYRVKVPTDRQVVLVANAKRLTGKREESYTWCVTVATTERGPVHLSNANWLGD